MLLKSGESGQRLANIARRRLSPLVSYKFLLEFHKKQMDYIDSITDNNER